MKTHELKVGDILIPRNSESLKKEFKTRKNIMSDFWYAYYSGCLFRVSYIYPRGLTQTVTVENFAGLESTFHELSMLFRLYNEED